MQHGQLSDTLSLGEEGRGGEYQHGLHMLSGHGREGGLELGPGPHPDGLQLHLERPPYLLQGLESRGVGGGVWIPQHGDPLGLRDGREQELEPFGTEVGLQQGQA